MDLFMLIVSIAIISGVLNGMTSVGGGVLFLFSLIMISSILGEGAGFSMQLMTAMTAFHAIGCSLSASWFFYKKNLYEKRSCLFFGGSTFVGALGGSLFANTLSSDFLQLLFFFLALLAAMSIFFNRSDRTEPKKEISYLWFLPLGVAIGFVGGIFGLGLGFLVFPVLVAIYRQSIHEAVGSAMLVSLAMTFGTLMIKVGTPGLNFGLSAGIVVGGMIGAWVGGVIAVKLQPRYLQSIIAVLLAGISLKFLLDWII